MWNNIIVSKLLILHWNTLNQVTVGKLFVLYKNTWNHMTLCQQMNISIK